MKLIRIESVLARMAEVDDEHPTVGEWETDARYVWPQRWADLRRFLEAKREAAGGGGD